MKEQDIPYKQLEALGLNTKALTQEDISRLLHNEKTEVRAFSIEYTKDREDFLKNENIKYNIREDGGKKKSFIDPNKCDGCGLCAALCPKDAIKMEGPVPVYLGDFN